MLRDSGLSIVAKGAHVRLFQYAAISLDFGRAISPDEIQRRSRSGYLSPSPEPIHFLTSTSSLPVLCALMTRETYDIRSPTLRIRMGEGFQGSPVVAKSYFENLLPCLKQVRGFVEVKIQGLGSYPWLVGFMEAKMCKRRRSAAETMYAVSGTIWRATTALDEGKHQLAINGYKMALSILRGSRFNSNERSKVLRNGRYGGLPAGL